MKHESRKTKDPNVIRKWAEQRGGVPAAIAETEQGEDPGILRIHFPDAPDADDDDPFDQITWDVFFEKFESKGLTFLYQEETEDGGISRFHKLTH